MKDSDEMEKTLQHTRADVYASSKWRHPRLEPGRWEQPVLEVALEPWSRR